MVEQRVASAALEALRAISRLIRQTKGEVMRSILSASAWIAVCAAFVCTPGFAAEAPSDSASGAMLPNAADPKSATSAPQGQSRAVVVSLGMGAKRSNNSQSQDSAAGARTKTGALETMPFFPPAAPPAP